MCPRDGPGELDRVGRKNLDECASSIRSRSALGVYAGLERPQEGRVVAGNGLAKLTAARGTLTFAAEVKVCLPRDWYFSQ